MGNRWGTEGLDEAHARQLQQLLRDVSKLDQVVLSQVDSCISDQVSLGGILFSHTALLFVFPSDYALHVCVRARARARVCVCVCELRSR